MNPAAQVLSPAQAAAVLGVHPNTIRNMVKRGELRDAFAHLELRRIGIARADLEQLISPAPVVVAGRESGPAAAVPHGNNGGGPHLRTVPGGATPGAA